MLLPLAGAVKEMMPPFVVNVAGKLSADQEPGVSKELS